MEKLQRMLTFLLTRACPTLSSRFREHDWNVKPFPLVIQTNKKGAILQHPPAEYCWIRTPTNKINLKQRRRWKTPFAVWLRLDEQLLLMLTCENQVRTSWRGCEVNGSVYTQEACVFFTSLQRRWDGRRSQLVWLLDLRYGCQTQPDNPVKVSGRFFIDVIFSVLLFFLMWRLIFTLKAQCCRVTQPPRAAHSPASVTATRQPWIQV